MAAFVPERGHDYRVRVRRPPLTFPLRSGWEKRGGGGFHLVALGGGLRHASSVGSIPFPGDGSEVIAVGAVDAVGRQWHRFVWLEVWPDQTRPGDDGAIPQLLASRPFAGTSAAAPQAERPRRPPLVAPSGSERGPHKPRLAAPPAPVL